MVTAGASIAIGQGWDLRGGGTTLNLNSVSFVSANVGTAVGDSGIILRTSDGGVTWQTQSSGTQRRLLAVSFYNEQYGYIGTDTSIVLFTRDGGVNWITRITGSPASFFIWKSVIATDTGRVLVGSGDNHNQAQSTDCGVTWTIEGCQGVESCSFYNTRIGVYLSWADCSKTPIEVYDLTTDGGITWVLQSSDIAPLRFYGIAMTDSNAFVCVGNGGAIYKHTFLGPWDPVPSGVSNNLSSAVFLDRLQGVVVGAGVILKTSDGGESWTVVHRGDTLKSVVAPSADAIYAVGNNGEIMKSVDGGNHWAHLSMKTNVSLTNAFSLSDSVIIVAGIPGFISRSSDGGNSWSVRRTLPSTSYNITVVGLKYYDPLHAVAIDTRSIVLRTSDGGMTWNESAPYSSADVRSVGFYGLDSIISISWHNGALVYLSTDRGVTWSPRGNASLDLIFRAAFLRGGVCYAIGKYYQNSLQRLERSTDFGATWKESKLALTFNQNFAFANDSTGFLLGSDYVVYKTVDSGSTWRPKASSNGLSLNGIGLSDRNNVIVVGDSGLIMRTTDGGDSWKRQSSGTDQSLQAVDMQASRSAFILGDNGIFLQSATGGYPVPGPIGPANRFPPDKAVNQKVNLTLTWDASLNADSYHLRFGKDPSFSSKMIDDSSITLQSRGVVLDTSTTYYWRVRGFNPGGGGDFTPVYSFTTIPFPPAPPKLLSPDSAAVDQVQNGLTLRWRSVAPADSFQVQIAKDPGFVQRVADAILKDTTFATPGLDTSTTYFWHVRGKNPGGFGAYSNAFRFVTVPLKPPPVTLISPNNSDTSVARPVNFGWSSSARSAIYRLQVSGVPAFGGGVVLDTAISGLTFRFGILDPARTYYWRVFASNAGGTDSAVTVRSFKTAPGAPAPPTLLQPPPGSLQLRNVTLTWKKKSDASDYHIRLAHDSVLMRQVSNLFSVDTLFVPPQLQYDSTYFWTVSARNAGGEGDSAFVARFRTIPPPPVPPKLPSPHNGDTLQASSLQLAWDVSTGSTAYHVQLSRDPAFGSTVFDDTIRTGTSTPIAALIPGNWYYWRVQGRNLYEWGDYSSTWSFKVAVAPEAPTIVYPAPGSADINPSGPLTFQWGNTSNTSRYQIQVALVQSFARVVFNDSTVTATEKLVSPLAHATRYFWRVRGISANGIRGHWSDSTKYFTTRSDSTFTYSLSFPSSSPPVSSYRLVSFPGQSGIPVNQILSGSQKTAWRLLRENGSSSPPFFADLTSDSSVIPGEGYWLLKINPLDFVRKVTLPAPDSNGIVSIPVRKGWNIIGNPYAVSVPWSTVTSATGIDTLQKPQIYTGVQGSPWGAGNTLDPFVGYYFYNSVATLASLKVRYPFPMFIQPLPKPVPYDWKVVVHLQVEGQDKDITTMGISPVARQGYDVLDTYLPPSVADDAQISMRRPEWDSAYSHFSSDIRQSLGEGQSWDFEVQGKRSSKGLLRFEGANSVPSESRAVLVDLQNIVPIEVRSVESYPFTLSATTMSFRLLVGTAAYVEKEIAELMPKEFSLSQNFPNPFNPSTTIRYDVPQHARIELDILNILGQRVETLVSIEQNPGKYSVIWDAQGTGSRGVASGIYFSRLRADGRQIAVRKLILLK
jgi:photosystem II stability/assembly factor-like uncharacterized protein